MNQARDSRGVGCGGAVRVTVTAARGLRLRLPVARVFHPPRQSAACSRLVRSDAAQAGYRPAFHTVADSTLRQVEHPSL
jgi:hypothetical protein